MGKTFKLGLLGRFLGSLLRRFLGGLVGRLDRELQGVHPSLLASLEMLTSIFNLLFGTKVDGGKLDDALCGSLAFCGIDDIGPGADVDPEAGRIPGRAVFAVVLVDNATVEEDMSDVRGGGEHVEGGEEIPAPVASFVPSADDDAMEKQTVGGTDDGHEDVEGDGRLEMESLSIEDGEGLVVDGAVDAKEGRNERGAILVPGLLALDRPGTILATSPTPASVLLFEGAAHEGAAVGLDEEGEVFGCLDKSGCVDHVSNLGRQVEDSEGDVLLLLWFLGLLDLLLGFLL